MTFKTIKHPLIKREIYDTDTAILKNRIHKLESDLHSFRIANFILMAAVLILVFVSIYISGRINNA